MKRGVLPVLIIVVIAVLLVTNAGMYELGNASGYQNGFNRGHLVGLEETIVSSDTTIIYQPGNFTLFWVDLFDLALPQNANFSLLYDFTLIPLPSSGNLTVEMQILEQGSVSFSTGYVINASGVIPLNRNDGQILFKANPGNTHACEVQFVNLQVYET